jgi:hypothetical protein
MFYSYLHDASCPFAAAGVEPPNANRDRALSLIKEERQRQVGKWSIANDDTRSRGELAMAAACYAAPEPLRVANGLGGYDTAWPWPKGEGCDPSAAGDDRLRSLVIAGALIVAEIERLSRTTAHAERAL